MVIKEAHFTDYQTFYEYRSDLEDDGYKVTSFSDDVHRKYWIRIERTEYVPALCQDPEIFVEVKVGDLTTIIRP